MEENLRDRLSLFADLEAKLEKLEKIVNVEILAVEAAVVSATEKAIKEVVAEKMEALEEIEEAEVLEGSREVKEAEVLENLRETEEAELLEISREIEEVEYLERPEEIEELEEPEGLEDSEMAIEKADREEPEEFEEIEEVLALKNKSDGKQQKTKQKHSQPSILRELVGLGIKIAIIALTGIITFTFVFGFHRNTDPDMFPMVKSGDLVMYYRLDKNYSPGDLVVLDFNGELQVRRVIAKEGDVVDIDDRGLKINDAWQQEQEIYQETWQYEEGIDFPITVGPGQVFVLGDERENATDSRMYGAVDVENTRGTVVTVIRRRNF